MQSPPHDYAFAWEAPGASDYLRLRRECGLSSFTQEAAEAGLAGTRIGLTVLHEGGPVGMGRVIGDGGLFFQIVDIAVLPEHQGKGLGKAIMHALIGRLRDSLPAEAYVSLIADGEARRLYAQFGFAPVAPKSIGMACRLGPRDQSPSSG